MRRIVFDTIRHVTSEPGDMTHYDYFIYKNGDSYNIMPRKSSFLFPTTVNYWEIKDINTLEDTINFIEDHIVYYNVNPNTMFEVINAIKEINDNS